MLKQTTLLVVLLASVVSLSPNPVGAATTCKVVPSLCPPAPGGGNKSVPEPATLVVLGVGACAAAIAARRRNKK